MKIPVGLKLSAEAIRLLKALAASKGLSQASVIEMLLREAAKREGLK